MLPSGMARAWRKAPESRLELELRKAPESVTAPEKAPGLVKVTAFQHGSTPVQYLPVLRSLRAQWSMKQVQLFRARLSYQR